ncbi:YceD family protein [Sphingomonas sp. Tas61C01]|uniref:YceD family protein n=1 Tax=Sphingomonas sp. Tas61C01 TaxID=3458297 RepID=UPI00403ED7C0
MTPEFSRPERVDTIGDRARAIEIGADEAERAALARRFDLVAIDRLDAQLTVRREGGGITVTGSVAAAVVQACSVTDEPLAVTIDEPVALRFVEALDLGEEVELDEGALDTVEIENGVIDLGEAAAETMALALDPFPRGPGAAAALKAAGVIGEEEVVPFNALTEALKAKLQR